jgi:undecaprenyl-diphosphatase
MRDDAAATVTSGGQPAPLGARGATARETPLTAVVRPRTLLVALVVVLAGYAALAADVVNGGAFTELDAEVAEWVVRSMPTWVEWLARPFTWLGGVVGMTVAVIGVSYALLRRRMVRETVVLLVVTLGSQALVLSAKASYERERPDVGSAIELPESFSFPSGHATTGVAVFGLLGLYAAALATTRRRRVAAILGGFGLGALIAASRVILNVHYLADVLAGACLGLAWLCTCLLGDAWLRSRRRRATGA